jgi:hypothetical protein
MVASDISKHVRFLRELTNPRYIQSIRSDLETDILTRKVGRNISIVQEHGHSKSECTKSIVGR